MTSYEFEQSNVLPVFGSFDVVVIGGGVAGCAAALAAAREGKSVLLLEKQTVLGGLATSGHIVLYLPLCDGFGHQVMAGIAEEFMLDSIKYSYGDDNTNWQGRKRYETRFNGPAFALALEEKLINEGVTIMYDTLFVGSAINNGFCEAVIVENKSGRGAYLVKAVVDSSGDAEVFSRAGMPCQRTENNLAVWCYVTTGDKHILKRGSAPERGLQLLTMGNIDKAADRDSVIQPYYGDSGEAVNRFIIDGHKQLLGEIKHESAVTLASLPGMAQIRMARRIEGEYTLTKNDLERHFEDNIGATGDWRKSAPVYEIPYRTLYSAKLSNVLAAGRCISSEGETWEVTRVIPPAVVTGQAAGVAAAMIAESKIPANELDVGKLRDKLNKVGVMLDFNGGNK